MHLPEGVEVSVKKKKNGKTYVYYYWNPGRGTKREVERIRLPDPEKQPRLLWAEVERRQTETPTTYPARSIGDLLARYRKSDEFTKNAEGTKRNYEVHMRRFEDPDTWGMVPVNDLTPLAVQTARDAMKETPVMANQMLAVGRTIWDWAIPLDLAKLNPFEKIKDIDVPDRGHVPWPSWVIDYVREHAWPDLVRMERLGIMTCQRGSDLIRMGPEHRERNGIWCRPKKTRRHRRAFFIPLATVDALELDRWAETPVTFHNKRFKQPVEQLRPDLYLFSPRATEYNPESLRSRWGRWLVETDAGKELCRRWREWLAECVTRYEWEIDPEDARGPTIHGLRGSGILLRVAAGYNTDQIANDVGMSRPMVDRYMRFRDQMEVAVAGRGRLKAVDDKG